MSVSMGRKRSAGAVSDPCSRLVGTCPHSLGEDSGKPLDGDGGTLSGDWDESFCDWCSSLMQVIDTIGKRGRFRNTALFDAQANRWRSTVQIGSPQSLSAAYSRNQMEKAIPGERKKSATGVENAMG